jgi:tetratricopeptide (TPR) repeat protein
MRVLVWVLGGLLATAALAQDIKPAAAALWREAMDYHRAKDPARAMEAFLKAYHADPAVLGLENAGLLDGAIDHVKRQLDVKKDDLVFTFKLAELLNMKGNLTEAIVTYRKVVAINPNSPMAQVASDEARKLESFQKALATPTTPSPSPAPSPEPSASATPPTTAQGDLQLRVDELEKKLKDAQTTQEALQEEHDKLKEEHEKLKAEYEKAQYYKNLFFANPKNVENLGRRQIR